MSDTTFETLLTGQLRGYAEAGVRPIDRHAIAEGVIGSGARGRLVDQLRSLPSWWRIVPRQLLVLLVLVALLSLAAVLLVFSAGEAPEPVTRASGYEAIFLRATADAPGQVLDIVAITSDGHERLIKHLDATTTPADRSFRPFGSVSQDGWVAVDAPSANGSEAWALMDLAEPTRERLIVPYSPAIGGAWSPNGLFATLMPGISQCCSVQITEARTGSTTPLGNLNLPGGGPDFIWAANGSGLLVALPDNRSTDQIDLGTRPIDGGPVVPGAPSLAPRLQARWVTGGGLYLLVCQTGDCPGSSSGTVRTRDAAGAVLDWYHGELAPASLLDASFSADGRSIWLLLDRVSGADHVAVLARMDAPGKVRIVGSVSLGPGVAYMWFAGLAADDSSVAIGHWIGQLGAETVEGPVTLMRTDSGTTIAHGGRFIGWVPASVADAWPGEGGFTTVPKVTEPTAPTATPSPLPGSTPTADPNATPPPVSVPASPSGG